MLKTYFDFTRNSIFRPEAFSKKRKASTLKLPNISASGLYQEKHPLSNYLVFWPDAFTKKNAKHSQITQYFDQWLLPGKTCTLKVTIILARGLYLEKNALTNYPTFRPDVFTKKKNTLSSHPLFRPAVFTKKKTCTLKFESASFFLGKGLWSKYRVKSKIKMFEKLNKEVDSLYLYLPSNGKLNKSPKPARWYGNTGFNIVVFVLL